MRQLEYFMQNNLSGLARDPFGPRLESQGWTVSTCIGNCLSTNWRSPGYGREVPDPTTQPEVMAGYIPLMARRLLIRNAGAGAPSLCEVFSQRTLRLLSQSTRDLLQDRGHPLHSAAQRRPQDPNDHLVPIPGMTN